MRPTPSVIVFDVNETLSDLGPMASRFDEAGVPAHLAPLWFATLLRDGFALTAAGATPSFAQLGADALRTVLHAGGVTTGVEAAVEHVLAGMGRLPLHEDVPDGVRALSAAGYRLVTLSNGAVEVSEQLLAAAGLRGAFEAVLSVEGSSAWKPARSSYERVVRACGCEPGEVLLVAVHPWDVDGAARAGLRTAWIDRTGAPYPRSSTAPTVRARGLVDLAAQLAGAVGPGGAGDGRHQGGEGDERGPSSRS